MKTKLHIHSLLSLAVIAIATIFSSCSGSQAEVNELITSLNNYNQSIQEVTTANELAAVDANFIADIQKFSSSSVKLTEADRKAILKAVSDLGKTTNEKFGELSPSGKKPLSDEEYAQRLKDFESAINSCQTLGDVVNVGL